MVNRKNWITLLLKWSEIVTNDAQQPTKCSGTDEFDDDGGDDGDGDDDDDDDDDDILCPHTKVSHARCFLSSS